jgi:hypothetical protein
MPEVVAVGAMVVVLLVQVGQEAAEMVLIHQLPRLMPPQI